VNNPDDTLALYRGDSWFTNDKSSYSIPMHPDSSKGYIGFRIARTYKPEEINGKQDK
jgi:hypothetical protein